MTRLARGRGSLSLGTYDAPTSCMSLKCYLLSHLSCDMRNSFWEVRGWPTTRAKDNAPAEEQQPDPEKRQIVLVERTVWAWEPMIYKWAIHDWLCTGWNTASGGYGRLHRPLWCLFTHTPDHMSLWQIYMVALASVADPRLFDPRVGDDKTYITTMGMQQTSVHGRTTSCCKTGWENRTWWSPSPSSGFTTWPQWKERSFFQDHLWVIWTMEAGITTFLWFLVCALWLLLSQWLSCLVQFHLRGRGWTNFSPLFNDWDDTGPPPTCTSRLWVTWDIYMWDLLWHREAVLSGLGTFLKA